MLKSGFAPIATALIGIGVFALATQVRAGGILAKFTDQAKLLRGVAVPPAHHAVLTTTCELGEFQFCV